MPRAKFVFLSLLLPLFLLMTQATPAAAAIGPVSPNGHPIIYLGVTYFTQYNDLNADRNELQAIINAFGGSTYRYGTAYDVQLVIESEIAWDVTEPNGPSIPGDPSNFVRYQQFADLIRSMNLKWTPLLSYHYVPGWVSAKYGSCQYDAQHNPVSCTLDAMPNDFMPFVPGSAVWRTEAADWTKQALRALDPYFGNPIQVVLCGNEMLTSRRPSEAGVPTAADFDARSQAWANALTTLVSAAKSIVQGRVPVTSKLVPYELHATEMLRHGMFPHVYDLLDSLDVIAVDAYPPTDTEYQALFRGDKGLFLSEFNGQTGGASGDELLAWVKLGVSHYNLRYASWFCWKCGPTFSMTADEQRGMRDAINWVTGLSAVYNQPSRSVVFQLSTDILRKSDSSWMVHPEEVYRHNSALSLGSQLSVSVRYEVDYRPRTSDVQIAQVADARSVGTFSRRAIYLLESATASVSAPEGRFYTSGNGGNSDGVVSHPASLAYNQQVFHWTPVWQDGVRRLERSGTVGQVTDWIVAPGPTPQAQQLGNSFFIAQGTLTELWYHGCPLLTVLNEMINTGTGTPAPESCVASQGAYISHFTGAGCTGTESYYLPYDGYAYQCRTWDGSGRCGTVRRAVTNRSYRYNGACFNFPSANTLSDFVSVYR